MVCLFNNRLERKFPGANSPGSESSRALSLPGAKVPTRLSLHCILGTFAPGSESAWERKVPVPLIALQAVSYTIYEIEPSIGPPLLYFATPFAFNAPDGRVPLGRCP